MNKIYFKSFGKNFRERGFATKPKFLRQILREATPINRKILVIKLVGMKYFIGGKDVDKNGKIEVFIHGDRNGIIDNRSKVQVPFYPNALSPKIQAHDELNFQIDYKSISFLMFKIRVDDKVEAFGGVLVSNMRQGMSVVRLYDKQMYNNETSHLIVHTRLIDLNDTPFEG